MSCPQAAWNSDLHCQGRDDNNNNSYSKIVERCLMWSSHWLVGVTNHEAERNGGMVDVPGVLQ